MTYTYTRYFNDDDLAELRVKAASLRTNYEERKQYLEQHNRDHIEARLNVLDAVILMLGDRAE